MELRELDSIEKMPLVRELFREYETAIGVDLCFQGFDAELAGLPGRYAPPRGVILVAFDGERPAGCVALRPLEGNACEMKRLYVRPAWRGRGVGRLLAGAVVARAREIGYSSMKLDTLATMNEAIGLYRSLGFRETGSYCHNPLDNPVFMELDLA